MGNRYLIADNLYLNYKYYIIDPCKDYCKNGGECDVTDADNPICDCDSTGFIGETCETPGIEL